MSALEKFDEIGTCETNMESNDFKEEDVKLNVLDQAWLDGKDFNIQTIYKSFEYICVCVCALLHFLKQKDDL